MSNDLELVRNRLNSMDYHDMQDLSLCFQDATGWQELYGEFFFHAANSILGKHPNLLDKCKGWSELEELHNKLKLD